MWTDSHCHLDAPEFAHDVQAVMSRARAQGVACCVMPAVQTADFERLRLLAHELDNAYALGIHPLYVPQAQLEDLDTLDRALTQHQADPRLVAVGEIGLDFFVPNLCAPEMREKQEFFYHRQLALAQKHSLPVILHVRRSADRLLKGLRQCAVQGGIAHAFNGSFQQAHNFIDLGFDLGFGGAISFERALQLRRLATELPMSAVVLETDAPDIPPQWLYRTQAQRALSTPPLSPTCNEPCHLPRIGAVLAQLRGLDLSEVACTSAANAARVLPQLSPLLAHHGGLTAP